MAHCVICLTNAAFLLPQKLDDRAGNDVTPEFDSFHFMVRGSYTQKSDFCS